MLKILQKELLKLVIILNKMVNYGIIGCGNISIKRHIPILSKLKEVNIIAVADVNKYIVKETAIKHNIRYWFTDYNKLLNLKDIEVVVIAIPPHLHTEVCINSAKMGKHIYVEKPIAITLKDAKKIIDICNNKKVKLCVGHTQRFFPVYRKTKEIIKRGYLGNIYKVKMYNCLYVDWPMRRNKKIGSQWRINSDSKYSGPLMDVGCHYLDSLHYLLDQNVIQIYAEIDKFVHKKRKAEDNVMMLIRFNKGTIAQLELSESQYMDKDKIEGVEVYGNKGSLYYQTFIGEIKFRSILIDKKASIIKKIKTNSEQSNIGFATIHKEFLRSLKNNIAPPITGSDGYKVLKIIEGAYQSSQNKKIIYI